MVLQGEEFKVFENRNLVNKFTFGFLLLAVGLKTNKEFSVFSL